MEITVNTRYDIGDTVYFLNETHDITKGCVNRIITTTRIYKDSYTGQQKDFAVTEYDVSTTRLDDHQYTEDELYSTPDEIVAMFNDQIEHGEFD